MPDEQSPRIYTLPLFPLNHVLFPHFLLQLHVFEERYRVMLGDCIQREIPFGVVLIREGSEVGEPAVPYEIGCTARVMEAKYQEDGRIYIVAVGVQRFRLLEYSEAQLPYLVGRVEDYEDTEAPHADLSPTARQTSVLFRRYLHLLADAAGLPLPDIQLPEEPALLAFCIAAGSQIPQRHKQNLLSMTDPLARLREEKDYLREQIDALEAYRAGNSATEETGTKYMVAEPLDSNSLLWDGYRRDSPN